MILPFLLQLGILLLTSFPVVSGVGGLCSGNPDTENLVIAEPNYNWDRYRISLDPAITADTVSLRYNIRIPEGKVLYGRDIHHVQALRCFDTEYRVTVIFTCSEGGEERTLLVSIDLQPIRLDYLRQFNRDDYGVKSFYNVSAGESVTLTCQTDEDRERLYRADKYNGYGRIDEEMTMVWFKANRFGASTQMNQEPMVSRNMVLDSVGCSDAGLYYCKMLRCPYHGLDTAACNNNIVAIDNRQNYEPPTTRRCSVFGDPHIYTFDGGLYSYKGDCWYILAMDKSARWFVYGWFSHCGEYSACLESISIIVRGDTTTQVQFLRGYAINLGYKKLFLSRGKSEKVPGVKLFFTGDRLLAELSQFPVTVTFDGLAGASVIVDKDAPTMGLCGNNNGDPSDDFSSFYDGLERNSNEFADAWSVGRGCKLSSEFEVPDASLDMDDIINDPGSVNLYLTMPRSYRMDLCRKSIYGPANSKDAPLATVMALLSDSMVDALMETCAQDIQYIDDFFTFHPSYTLQLCLLGSMLEERAGDLGICVEWTANTYACPSPDQWRREAVRVGCVWTEEDKRTILQ